MVRGVGVEGRASAGRPSHGLAAHPAKHSLHCVAPVAFWKEPGAQSSHASAPDTLDAEPSGHGAQSASDAPPGCGLHGARSEE